MHLRVCIWLPLDPSQPWDILGRGPDWLANTATERREGERKKRGTKRFQKRFYCSLYISDKGLRGIGRCFMRERGRDSQQNMTNLEERRRWFYYLLAPNRSALGRRKEKANWQHCWLLIMSQTARAEYMTTSMTNWHTILAMPTHCECALQCSYYHSSKWLNDCWLQLHMADSIYCDFKPKTSCYYLICAVITWCYYVILHQQNNWSSHCEGSKMNQTGFWLHNFLSVVVTVSFFFNQQFLLDTTGSKTESNFRWPSSNSGS